MVPSGKSKRVLFHIVYIIKVYSKTVLPVTEVNIVRRILKKNKLNQKYHELKFKNMKAET